MTKWIRFAAGVLIGAVLLPGCTGGAGGNGGNGGGTTSASGAAAGGTGNVSSDEKITRAVQDKLDADPALKATGIKAKSTGAQVELTGAVKTIADKDKAEAAANEAIKAFSSVNAGIVDSITITDSSSGDTGSKTPPASGQ